MHASSTGSVLFGKAQRAVLALLFGHPDRDFYLSEIMSYARTGASQVQKELRDLTAAGLLVRERRGRQVYYRANRAAPIFDELKRIVTKTFGVADVVSSILDPFRTRIELAFLYGSIARGDETATSDVDLFIVGDVGVSDLATGLVAAEAELRRKVSPTIYGRDEFVAKLRGGHPFLGQIAAGAKIFLIGTQPTLDELARG
jgi:predicted nucleotidyltransferase